MQWNKARKNQKHLHRTWDLHTIHTLYNKVNTQCINMLTTHPHTWSPLHPLHGLLSCSFWLCCFFPPSIFLLSLRRWRWLVKWEEEKAAVRPFPLDCPDCSTWQRNERWQLASRYVFLFSVVLLCVGNQNLSQISSSQFMVLSVM